MKGILHPDYWVQVPAGEWLTGISQEQRNLLWERLRELVHYAERTQHEQRLIDSAIQTLQDHKTLRKEELDIFGFEPRDQVYAWSLYSIPPQQLVKSETFYIARFPITGYQYWLYEFRKYRASRLPGPFEKLALEHPDPGSAECVADFSRGDIATFCMQLGARLPMPNEWEKAARGTDGRLYPWGDEWNPHAGFFTYNGQAPKSCSDGKPAIDAYPEGVSPYGVWGMLGHYPEWVIDPSEKSSKTIKINGAIIHMRPQGFHPKDMGRQEAMASHILARAVGESEWGFALRPVKDSWPRQQWKGANIVK